MTQLVVRQLGLQPYEPMFEAMKAFTSDRQSETPDEFWFLQHEPVFTQGRAGKAEYLLDTADIPVVQIDRGGQVTYHGPGQLTVYLLLDLKRLGLGVREFVTCIEQSLVRTLSHWGIESYPRADAPGVYVNGAKIAALGLRISRGRSYHGLNFNIAMDMMPWSRINPCGLGVDVIQLADILPEIKMPSLEVVSRQLLTELLEAFGYNGYQSTEDMPTGYAQKENN